MASPKLNNVPIKAICNDTSITAEVWPNLQGHSLGSANSPYAYTTTTGDTIITASDGAGVVVQSDAMGVHDHTVRTE